MGLWKWFKDFARQVADDDLEGSGASTEEAGAPGSRDAPPLYADSDTGGAPAAATAPDPAEQDDGEADDEAAAAWVVYNEQNRGGGDGGDLK